MRESAGGGEFEGGDQQVVASLSEGIGRWWGI